MYRLNFKIETLSPVVISSMSNSTIMTGSHSEIGGSIIRGVLASKYVAEKNLGNRAHADKNFTELFYGGLKFLSANLGIEGKRSFNLPLSLQRGKKGTPEENKILDLLTVEETPPGYKTLRGYGAVDGGKIFSASANKNIFMHMSRSAANERISGKSNEGHIYNYEALEEGQIFCGEILGEKSLLEKLNLQNKTFEARVGRSKFTQYGKCKFTFANIEEIKPADFGEKFYLRLESPLIPFEENFIGAEKVLTDEVIKKLGENFKLGKIFSSGVEVENFYMTMKRPRVMALAAGTVFEIISENLTPADKKIICEKIYGGFGTRTEEGFGQIRFWQAAEFTVGKVGENKFSNQKIFSAGTLEIAQKILFEKYLEQIRIYAHEDAKNLKFGGGNFTHFFSRLNTLLSSVEKKNLRENFSKKISDECKGGKQLQDNLKKFRIDGQTLYDIFTQNAKLPYEGKKIFDNIEELSAEIKFNEKIFDDKICFDYLQNLFRFARKNAAIAKGGDNDD